MPVGPVGPVNKTAGHSDNLSEEFGCGVGVDWWNISVPCPGSGQIDPEPNHDPCAVEVSRIGSDIHTVV